MRSLNVSDCEVLSIHSGRSNCPLTGKQVPVLLVTIRLVDQAQPINLAIRNPDRLLNDVPAVMSNSSVLNGGEFFSEDE